MLSQDCNGGLAGESSQAADFIGAREKWIDDEKASERNPIHWLPINSGTQDHSLGPGNLVEELRTARPTADRLRHLQ